MKTLYIIRHAKSSWSFDMADIDRPLGIRGRRDAPKVGKYLSENEPTPDLMISSPASRALYTSLLIGDEWGYPEDDIAIEKRLYHASAGQALKVLEEVKPGVESIAIFGHNPGFTELVNHFSTEYLDNLPTTGVGVFNFSCKSWADVSKENVKNKKIIIPKKL